MGIIRTTSVNVTGCSEGETYQFRVCAINEAGQGPPSGGCEPVQCRPYMEPPGIPEKPRITNVTKNSVGLSWNRPVFDGGASIEGYIIEKRKVGEKNWIRANTNGKLIRNTIYILDGLPEKTQFEFRIIAVNRAGESDPSLPSNIVFTEDQPSRTILDLSQLKDITVRAGEIISFTIPYTSGGCKPTVDAFNGINSIYEGDRTTINIDDNQIVFTTNDSKRSDAGNFFFFSNFKLF